MSNIFRYEIATGEIEALTNAETGFFRPVPLDDGSLLVFRYTGEGFVPSIIDAHAGEGHQPDHVPRPAGRREASDPEAVGRRVAGIGADRVDDHAARASTAR